MRHRLHIRKERPDLDAYVAMAAEFEARSIVDIGCGTGELACRLARLGYDVAGTDPADASLGIARGKPGADKVRWVCADTVAVAPGSADLAVMTGNVAQVFVSDEEWADVLDGVHTALRPGGHFVFETRVPSRQAWRHWTPELSLARRQVDGVGLVEAWVEVTEVRAPLVSFRWSFRFLDQDELLTSNSTLRFRERPEIEASLAVAGFHLLEVRDAPDRPGAEWVFVARRSRSGPATVAS